MKLYLVRHAIPASISSGKYKTDAERPLTEAGIAQAKMVANALRALSVELDLVVTSPYIRAYQTAEIFASKNSCEIIRSSKLAPGVDAQNFVDALDKYEDKEAIMLVGHEPDMGELVSVLLGGSKMFRLPFKKGGVCCIECSELPPALSGTLSWMITPELISDLVRASV